MRMMTIQATEMRESKQTTLPFQVSVVSNKTFWSNLVTIGCRTEVEVEGYEFDSCLVEDIFLLCPLLFLPSVTGRSGKI